jgi:hypothetical protein
LGHLVDDAYAGTLRARLHEEYVDELLIGYELERETIWDFLDDGRLTLPQANELRLNVNKLESHTLADDQNDAMLKLISAAERRESRRKEAKGQRNAHNKKKQHKKEQKKKPGRDGRA